MIDNTFSCDIASFVTIQETIMRERTIGLISTLVLGLLAAPLPVEAQPVKQVIQSLERLDPSSRMAKLIEGAKREGKVVLYTATNITETREFLKVFKRLYPFLEANSYRAGGFRLANKVISEARTERYEADLIQVLGHAGSEISRAGLVHPYLSPERKHLRREFMDKEGMWTSVQHIRVALGYNTSLVKKEEAPKSYRDLLEPKWKGKFVIDTEDQDVLSAFIDAWGEERALGLFRGFAKNNVALRRSRTLQAQLLAAGEFHVAPFLHGNRPALMKRQGAPVEVVMLEPYITKVSTLYLAKQAPNPHAALLLYDFLLSKESQNIISSTFGRGSVRADMKGIFPELEREHYQIVNPDTAGPRLRALRKFFDEVLGVGG
jgi:iron(III) transport system substrate-binding protein